MPYLIVTQDRADGKPIRDAHRAAHYAYLQANQGRLIASGGLQDENGQYVGGAIILDAETLADAQAFADGDPFSQAGLFDKVTIVRWVKAFFNGRQAS
ncbi:YciI family protein [Chelatococcus asaccharovorans]|uniref:YCII-related domain-containing protein n=1 Tax=Chelatococcus asaccharovorans TaxID=28210 RepID=A0A2V3TW56_9HYPH|nr:YciI family protein [Chelatococcus asaccharovorans]MBS7706128.1 YciI family protein [Chelatococcus asaccharovorans]PXW52498.1 hypothetical protein C7450_11672 [Chelatococcus asaccharovorans]CAH1659402.1 YCII domain-containing protein [Chelatococcus asaccharovorans]CAH1687967.1 YCII domain-containing protein [Chelatococcus asaccharovorans]